MKNYIIASGQIVTVLSHESKPFLQTFFFQVDLKLFEKKIFLIFCRPHRPTLGLKCGKLLEVFSKHNFDNRQFKTSKHHALQLIKLFVTFIHVFKFSVTTPSNYLQNNSYYSLFIAPLCT